MGLCQSIIKEVRFVIEDELTHVYCLINAVGDCPDGVQGWHYKVFPASKSAIDILTYDFTDHLSWPLSAPSR